jgi:hypothetical protein
MGFAPIELRDYVRKHLKSNPGDKKAEVVAQIESAVAAYNAGERCSCGEPIWVIGSSQVGHMCFTCITGEADPDHDYEIVEACDNTGAP